MRAASKRCSNARRQARPAQLADAPDGARPPRRRRRRRSRSRRRSITSGTEPVAPARSPACRRPCASIITSPNGSGQSIGKSSASRLAQERVLLAPPTSPTNSTHGRDSRSERLDGLLEVGALLRVDLGRDLERSGRLGARSRSARSSRFSGDDAARGRPGSRRAARGTCAGRAAGRGGPSPASSPTGSGGAGRRRSRPAAPRGTPRRAAPRSGAWSRPCSVVTLGTGWRRSSGKCR